MADKSKVLSGIIKSELRKKPVKKASKCLFESNAILFNPFFSIFGENILGRKKIWMRPVGPFPCLILFSAKFRLFS
jgi:hypothetical protein